MTKARTVTRSLQCAILTMFLLMSCSRLSATTPLTRTPTPPYHTPTPLPPTPTPLPPSPDATAAAFLNAWESGDYATMYAFLSPPSRVTFDAESSARLLVEARSVLRPSPLTIAPRAD